MKNTAEHIEHVNSLDAQDEISHFKEEFVVSDPSLIYMDGNSLGRLPKRTAAHLDEVISGQWGEQLIQSWNQNWFQAPVDIGEKIAQIIGAAPGQTIVSDSTSINLYKLVCAALQINHDRHQIISDGMNFPSDLYILQGCVNMLGNRHQITVIPSNDDITMPLNVMLDSITSDTALVTLSHVTFKSGFLYNIKQITQKAHQVGALVIWDLSHSVGAVPISLDEWDVDFATGCTYKYINGGPGSPAFLYVNHRLQDAAISPIWGWFGAASPFNFDLNYVPQQGVRRFVCGTPPVLSLLAIDSSVDLLLEAGIDNIRKKSVMLSEYFLALFNEYLQPCDFTPGSPLDSAQRGSHISIRHPYGYQINQCLIQEYHVIPDFRQPDNIRFGFAPLYTSFMDVWKTVEHLQTIVEQKQYEKYSDVRDIVT